MSSTLGVGGVEEAVAQLRAALEKDPAGFASDETTRAILERLNDEVARLYDEDDGDDDAGYAGADGDAAGDGSYNDAYNGRTPGSPGLNATSFTRRSSTGSALRREGSIQLPKGPKPVDLWRAAHESDTQSRDSKVVLTPREWSSLVDRLNASSKIKEQSMRQAQMKRVADEMTGMTFMPQISERSRELASNQRSLPERAAALMRKKQVKLERIRQERAQKELEGATFAPRINDYRPANPAATNAAALQRRIGNLMQYEMDRRLRADQRRSLLEEVEARGLTFAPSINKNSQRIVERLNRERAAAAAAAAAASGPASASASSASTAGPSGGSPRSKSGSRPLGRSFLPGHEQETFHPSINPRSAALFRPGIDDKDVYSRLYDHGAAARTRGGAGSVAAGEGGGDGGSVSGRPSTAAGRTSAPTSPSSGPLRKQASASALASSSLPVDEAGNPAPGHPAYFTAVPFEAGKHDFVLRRLLG